MRGNKLPARLDWVGVVHVVKKGGIHEVKQVKTTISHLVSTTWSKTCMQDKWGGMMLVGKMCQEECWCMNGGSGAVVFPCYMCDCL